MLILTRRPLEAVMIGNTSDPANLVTVTVLGVKGNHVRIGIKAPKHVPVHREEIYEAIQREQRGQQELSSPPKGVDLQPLTNALAGVKSQFTGGTLHRK